MQSHSKSVCHRTRFATFHLYALHRRTIAPRPIAAGMRPSKYEVHGTAGHAQTSELTEVYRQFAEAASGEWEGITATFGEDGTPQQLPERYVPGAFREWGVELYDWQSQCSMLASADTGTLTYRVRRMMPTVGCEADAVAFTEESQILWGVPLSKCNGVEARTVLHDGSFFSGPSSIPEDSNTAKLEFCLALPQDLEGVPRSRLRIIIQITRHWQTRVWKASSFDVHSERFEAAYQGGMDLTGCGGGSTGFATSTLTSLQDSISEVWSAGHMEGLIYSDGKEEPDPLTNASFVSSHQNCDAPVILLPLGLSARVYASGTVAHDTELHVDVGAICSSGVKRLLGRAVYSKSNLKNVSLGMEKRLS